MARRLDPQIKRNPGRPRKSESPAVDYRELDRLLVQGEAISTDYDGAAPGDVPTRYAYPTYRQIAQRLGVAPSLIGTYATKNECRRRRFEVERERARAWARAMDAKKLAARREESLAISNGDTVYILDACILSFFKALEEGRVRCTSIAELNTVVRLKQLLIGEVDSRNEIRGIPTLGELQTKYLSMLRRTQAASPEESGVVGTRLLAVEKAPSSLPSPPDDTSRNED
jgi:hypothetical protein